MQSSQSTSVPVPPAYTPPAKVPVPMPLLAITQLRTSSFVPPSANTPPP